MDTALTRKLARIQSALHLLGLQRDVLTDLADIKEYRTLEADLEETLTAALAKGLVPPDPTLLVRNDWLRIIKWSNEIQSAIIKVSEAGEELDILNEAESRKKSSVDYIKKWNLDLSAINKVKIEVEAATENLKKTIAIGRAQVVSEDWVNNRPYQELSDLADAYCWNEFIEQTQSPGKWSENLEPRERPLVSSWMFVQSDCLLAKNLFDRLNRRRNHIEELIQTHKKHNNLLNEIDHLIALKQFDKAQDLLQEIKPLFNDIDYEKRNASIYLKISESRQHEKQVSSLEVKSLEAIDSVVDSRIKLAKASIITRWKIKSEFDEAFKKLLNSISDVAVGLKYEYSEERLNRLKTQHENLICVKEMLSEFDQIPNVSERLIDIVSEAWDKADKTWEDTETKIARAAEKILTQRLGLNYPVMAATRISIGIITARWIPPGTFIMGSQKEENGRHSDEIPHEVVICNGFFMSESECTQEQWQTLMGSNPSLFKGPNLPVENVSWEESMEFCHKLTIMQQEKGLLPEGWVWRLPREAEWEYAARAGTKCSRYGDLDTIAWYKNNSGNKTHEVKGKLASPWGLYDMIGNVEELCFDWYGDYPDHKEIDPMGPISGSRRVYRGASYRCSETFARSASRFRLGGGRRSSIGFRPILSGDSLINFMS